MNVTIRIETPSDYKEVELLTYKAFVNSQVPPRDYCNEHLIVNKLRDTDDFLPNLSYVAELDGEIVGNITYSKSKIVCESGKEIERITFGPLSVLPKFQKMGIGSMLLNHTISKAKKLGYNAILIYGHPEYYQRFGFVNAEKYNITTHDGKNFDAFMALELRDGALDNIAGKFYYSDVFDIGKEGLLE